MTSVDTAEKEASEVLHSLLSVERIEKQEEGCDNSPPTFQATAVTTTAEVQEGDSQIQWHGPVSMSHPLFSAIEANAHFSQNMDEQQVVVAFKVL